MTMIEPLNHVGAPSNDGAQSYTSYPAMIEEILAANDIKLSRDQSFTITRVAISAVSVLLRASLNHRHTGEIHALIEHLVTFCAGPVTDDPAQIAGCRVCEEDCIGAVEKSPPNSDTVSEWSQADYDAGYRAAFDNYMYDRKASSSWKMGWEDGDREIISYRSDLRALEELPPPVQFGAFGHGNVARDHGLPYDAERDDEWKLAWIRRDIELG